MGFFSKLLNQSQPAACVLPETHAVIRQIVSVLGYDVVATPGYGARLAPALNSAVEYLDGQIAAIPGPLDISAAHYMHHPLVHALFPARQEIAHGMGRSTDVKQPLAFLAGADQPEAFALLGVRRQPSAEAAAAASGAAFCDHTLRSLAATESGARQGLRTAALTRLVTAFGEHVDKLRKAEKLTRGQWTIENRKDVADTDRDKPVLAAEELAPENLLNGLVAWLQRPSEFFQVTAGAGAAGATANSGQPLEALAELRCHDRRRWTVCLVRFPTAEGVAAVQKEGHQHRYIRI